MELRRHTIAAMATDRMPKEVWVGAGQEMRWAHTDTHTHTDLRSHSDSQAGTHRTRCVCMCVCVLKMRILQTLITNLGTEHHLRPKKHQETASLGQS